MGAISNKRSAPQSLNPAQEPPQKKIATSWEIPNELVLHVFRFLGGRDLLRAAPVSRLFQELSRQALIDRAVPYVAFLKNITVLPSNKIELYMRPVNLIRAHLLKNKIVLSESDYAARLCWKDKELDLEETLRNLIIPHPERDSVTFSGQYIYKSSLENDEAVFFTDKCNEVVFRLTCLLDQLALVSKEFGQVELEVRPPRKFVQNMLDQDLFLACKYDFTGIMSRLISVGASLKCLWSVPVGFRDYPLLCVAAHYNSRKAVDWLLPLVTEDDADFRAAFKFVIDGENQEFKRLFTTKYDELLKRKELERRTVAKVSSWGIPNELILHVIGFLEGSDLLRAAQVSTLFQRLSRQALIDRAVKYDLYQTRVETLNFDDMRATPPNVYDSDDCDNPVTAPIDSSMVGPYGGRQKYLCESGTSEKIEAFASNKLALYIRLVELIKAHLLEHKISLSKSEYANSLCWSPNGELNLETTLKNLIIPHPMRDGAIFSLNVYNASLQDGTVNNVCNPTVFQLTRLLDKLALIWGIPDLASLQFQGELIGERYDYGSRMQDDLNTALVQALTYDFTGIMCRLMSLGADSNLWLSSDDPGRYQTLLGLAVEKKSEKAVELLLSLVTEDDGDFQGVYQEVICGKNEKFKRLFAIKYAELLQITLPPAKLSHLESNK